MDFLFRLHCTAKSFCEFDLFKHVFLSFDLFGCILRSAYAIRPKQTVLRRSHSMRCKIRQKNRCIFHFLFYLRFDSSKAINKMKRHTFEASSVARNLSNYIVDKIKKRRTKTLYYFITLLYWYDGIIEYMCDACVYIDTRPLVPFVQIL